MEFLHFADFLELMPGVVEVAIGDARHRGALTLTTTPRPALEPLCSTTKPEFAEMQF